jgi:hypothetical protein
MKLSAQEMNTLAVGLAVLAVIYAFRTPGQAAKAETVSYMDKWASQAAELTPSLGGGLSLWPYANQGPVTVSGG